MLRLGLLFIAPMAAGCAAGGASDKDGSETGDEDTGEGGGTGTLWRPTGAGYAYFSDGMSDNSLFHLELTRCIPPKEGEEYYGFVSKGGTAPVALGAITVSGEEVVFDNDIGINALIEGYDTFEAWANVDGLQGSGEHLWTGQVDPIIYGVVQNLVIASEVTPTGEGSLRSVETAVEGLRDYGQAAVDGGFSLPEIHTTAEGMMNAIRGTTEDSNEDGSVDVFGEHLGLIGAGGYVELIKADLTAASNQVDPGNPIKDYANYAYDCTQKIETHADAAGRDAEGASVTGSDESALSRLTDSIEGLDYALVGLDENEDGLIDDFTEGTIECAIRYVSQMAQMNVAIP